jgi:hypothetical protein
MDKGCEKFSELLKCKSSLESERDLQMRFSYSPTLAHSEKFADLTGDNNPIHRELLDGETVVPAFLQNVAAILASRKAILEYGLNQVDFPVSYNRITLDNFVVSGVDYELLVTLKNKPLEIKVEIVDPKGSKVFGMNRTFEGVVPPEDYDKLIHSSSFDVTGQVLSQFCQVTGVVSSESNLYGMASSSSIIFGAYDAKKLPKMEEGVVPIYSGQEIYLDTSRSVRNDIDALLNVYEIPTEELKRGDKIKTMISSWNKGNLINRIASEIIFQSEKLPKLAVKKALRARKRCV